MTKETCCPNCGHSFEPPGFVPEKPRRKKAITVRGVEYASHAEAAAAVGVKSSTFSKAVQRGRVEGVGLGLTWPHGTKRGRAIQINGVKYNSLKQASETLGISRKNLREQLNRGGVIVLPKKRKAKP